MAPASKSSSGIELVDYLESQLKKDWIPFNLNVSELITILISILAVIMIVGTICLCVCCSKRKRKGKRKEKQEISISENSKRAAVDNGDEKVENGDEDNGRGRGTDDSDRRGRDRRGEHPDRGDHREIDENGRRSNEKAPIHKPHRHHHRHGHDDDARKRREYELVTFQESSLKAGSEGRPRSPTRHKSVHVPVSVLVEPPPQTAATQTAPTRPRSTQQDGGDKKVLETMPPSTIPAEASGEDPAYRTFALSNVSDVFGDGTTLDSHQRNARNHHRRSNKK